MKLQERGVLPESDIYIFNSSLMKKDYFYQMLCIGHYFCTYNYVVKPNTLDSYLLIYVTSGEMYITVDNKEKEILESGQLAILNCYARPSYGCTSNVEFYWIHFDSHGIGDLFNEIPAKSVTVADRHAMKQFFKRMMEPFEQGGQPSEALVNKYITSILTEFFEHDSENLATIPQKKFDNICNYINSNIQKKISNNELAEMANMSVYHFIRSFKKESGFTPHEYIQRARINTAIFLLKATSMSLSDITYKCGFANEAAFSNSFKALTGMTPLKCRQDARGSVQSRSKLAKMEFISDENE